MRTAVKPLASVMLDFQLAPFSRIQASRSVLDQNTSEKRSIYLVVLNNYNKYSFI